jgi:hypothetical protein
MKTKNKWIWGILILIGIILIYHSNPASPTFAFTAEEGVSVFKWIVGGLGVLLGFKFLGGASASTVIPGVPNLLLIGGVILLIVILWKR